MNKKEARMEGILLDTETDGVTTRIHGPYKPLFITLNQAKWLEGMIAEYANNQRND